MIITIVYFIGICLGAVLMGIIYSLINQKSKNDYDNKELMLLNRQHQNFIIDYLQFKEQLNK
jgi:hypothetical protein